MTHSQRILLAVAIIVVDVVAVFIPLTAVVAAYIILARPPWFREWIARVYSESKLQ